MNVLMRRRRERNKKWKGVKRGGTETGGGIHTSPLSEIPSLPHTSHSSSLRPHSSCLSSFILTFIADLSFLSHFLVFLSLFSLTLYTSLSIYSLSIRPFIIPLTSLSPPFPPSPSPLFPLSLHVCLYFILSSTFLVSPFPLSTFIP